MYFKDLAYPYPGKCVIRQILRWNLGHLADLNLEFGSFDRSYPDMCVIWQILPWNLGHFADLKQLYPDRPLIWRKRNLVDLAHSYSSVCVIWEIWCVFHLADLAGSYPGVCIILRI